MTLLMSGPSFLNTQEYVSVSSYVSSCMASCSSSTSISLDDNHSLTSDGIYHSRRQSLPTNALRYPCPSFQEIPHFVFNSVPPCRFSLLRNRIDCTSSNVRFDQVMEYHFARCLKYVYCSSWSTCRRKRIWEILL